MTISSYNQIYSCVFPGRLGKGGFEVQGQMSGKEKGHGRSRDWREWEESQAGKPKYIHSMQRLPHGQLSTGIKARTCTQICLNTHRDQHTGHVELWTQAYKQTHRETY